MHWCYSLARDLHGEHAVTGQAGERDWQLPKEGERRGLGELLGPQPCPHTGSSGWQQPGAGQVTAQGHGVCRLNRGLLSLFLPIPNLLADAS